MHYHKGQITAIRLPHRLWGEMVNHCRRKLRGDYLTDEGPSPKAFGLIGGKLAGETLSVELIVPLLKNVRDWGDQKKVMDGAMNRHAIVSETPLDQRGWVAEPTELDNALHTMQEQGLRLVGNYHMHRVAWAHDARRDTPTELDSALGHSSRMFMFIISMVNPELPTIRAFFEGIMDLELPVEFIS